METDSSSTPTGFIAGEDIGGSKVAAGLVPPTGEIHYPPRVPMLANDEPAAGLATITQAIDQVCGKAVSSGTCYASLRGIGICCPGPLDPHTGIVINPPTL